MALRRVEFARRRKELMDLMDDNSIAIVSSSEVKVRNRDVDFPYRQDSDFCYLTGFYEPESVAVLAPGREHGEFILFCRERDPAKETWDGYRSGPEGACKDFSADDAFPITDIDDILPGLIEGRQRVYSAMGSNVDFDRRLMEWVNVIRAQSRNGAQPPEEFVALDHLLHEMRLFKSAAEIKVMAEAAEISAAAHVRAMQYCQAGQFEYQLEAEINHHFAMNGARESAYSAIVGSGKNACTLHYIENNDELKEGDLVLIDAGCEYQYYASDITRTFPVSGKFTAPQKAIYELVLKSQLAAIASIKPGSTWDRSHEITVEVITAGLVKLGLLTGEVEDRIKDESYKKFYMHRAGHWLGMDVHDVGDYKVEGEWRVLETGMVMTVEPGIYIPQDCMDVAKQWRGIGVRIEDDVCVTKTGHKVLSAGAPKSVKDIERLMRPKRKVSTKSKPKSKSKSKAMP